jgi:hypothetical protein
MFSSFKKKAPREVGAGAFFFVRLRYVREASREQTGTLFLQQ